MKSFFKYFIIFVCFVLILFIGFVLVTSIPKKYIEVNMRQSAEFYKKKNGMHYLIQDREYSRAHYYADSMILNIIYNLDETKPIESVLMGRYYEFQRFDINDDFISTVFSQKEANQEYLRYWHGSILILKPLLVFFDIEFIYELNKWILYILMGILFLNLYKKDEKVAFTYLIGMIMTAFYIVPYCFEYSWTYYIMLISSILVIKNINKEYDYFYRMFFINGILTCFFDFLSTEIVTLFVPLIFMLYFKYKNGSIKGFKDCIIIVFKSCLLWSISYVFMWLSKWILTSLILDINAFAYVKNNFMLRINGLQGLSNGKELYYTSFSRNINNVFPFCFFENKIIIGLVFCLVLLFIDWKNIKKKWFSLILLLLSMTPYIRYLILANHSYRHAFFTFRIQIIFIICIGLIISECFNYKLLKKLRSRSLWN